MQPKADDRHSLAQSRAATWLVLAVLTYGCGTTHSPVRAAREPDAAAPSATSLAGSGGVQVDAAVDSGTSHAGTGAGQSSGPSSCKSSLPAAPAGCRAAAYYVVCTQGDETQSCLSDSAMQCSDLGGTNLSNCHDTCAADEYALGCGGVGPNAPSFSEPNNCRGFGRNPGGGSEAFCCPCDGASNADPLVGEWTYSGRMHALSIIHQTVTFNADKTLRVVEEVAPLSVPAGYVSNGCVTSWSYYGTYNTTVSSGVNQLVWIFTGGMANQLSGCDDASMNSPGTPITADAATIEMTQGLILPTTMTYVVISPSTLVLASQNADLSVNRSLGTVFMKTR